MATLPPRKGSAYELLRYVASHGVVMLEHVMAALTLPRATAYRHIAPCIKERLLERFSLPEHRTVPLRATP